MEQDRPKPDPTISALAMGGPVNQCARKSDSQSILVVNYQPAQSVSVAERLRLLEEFPPTQVRLQKIDATGTATNLRRFVRSVPACDIVHCNIAEPEAWTILALSHVLIARFFGKAVIADLGFSFDEDSFERPPVLLRMILGLCTLTVVTSERAAAVLSRLGVNTVQIPEALASSEFTDRELNSVQPNMLTTYPHGDQVAAECVIKAFIQVKAKYPRAEMTILTDARNRDACLKLISGRERSCIAVASAGDLSEAASCYAEADVFVNSSVVGGLRPMLKAMAAGLPVVAVSGYYRDELIVDHRNGLAYRENSPGELADRIIELVETPELIHELTDHARLSVADHSWSRISLRWLACYRELRRRPSTAVIAGAGRHSHQAT